MHSAFFDSSNLQILGQARHFDFWIKLGIPNPLAAVQSGDRQAAALYAHEFTHYVQLLTSSLGNLVAETERVLFFLKWALLYQVTGAAGGALELPVLEMLKRRPQIAENGQVRESMSFASAYSDAMGALCTSWVGLVKEEHFDPRTLRERRPFRLDSDARSLVYTRLSGDEIALPITALQLLELGAVASELLMSGGIILEGKLTAQMADYYGALLFLVQEGHLLLRPLGSGKVRVQLAGSGPDNVLMLGAAISLYVCCQVSQMLYADKLDDGGARLQTPFPQSVPAKFARDRMSASAGVFCRLIGRFGEVASILDRGALTPEERIELLCASLGLPSYSAMVEHQLRRARQAIDKLPPDDHDHTWAELEQAILSATAKVVGEEAQRIDAIDMNEVFRALFLRRSAVALEALQTHPEASISPILHPDDLPVPYIVYETNEGARRAMVAMPWQKRPRFLEIPKSVMSYFAETAMLVNKALFDTNLACYRDTQSRDEARIGRASLGCRHFEECYDLPKEAPIEFCRQEDWTRVASIQLQTWKDVGPIWISGLEPRERS